MQSYSRKPTTHCSLQKIDAEPQNTARIWPIGVSGDATEVLNGGSVKVARELRIDPQPFLQSHHWVLAKWQTQAMVPIAMEVREYRRTLD